MLDRERIRRGDQLVAAPVTAASAPVPVAPEHARPVSLDEVEHLWVDDPVDAFFLEIQGSGLVDMADGELIGVRYIGQNGHGYVPVGRVLIDWGEATADDMTLLRG